MNANGTEGALSTADNVTTSIAAPSVSHSAVTASGWVESWVPVSGASSYNVYAGQTLIKNVSGTSNSFAGETSGTSYNVQVAGVMSNGTVGPMSGVDTVTTAPAASHMTHSSITSSGWTETWSPVTGAQSYNVYVDGIQVASGVTQNAYDW